MSDKNLKVGISKFILGDKMKKALIILPVVGLLLVALAIAQEASQNISVTADVQPYYSVVFDYNTVDFGAVYPGFIPAPGNALGAYNVGVETNIPPAS